MRLIGILTVMLGFNVVSYAQNPPVQVKSLWDAPGGLNTSKPGHLIPDQDFTDLGDVFTDKGPYIEKRGCLATLYTTGNPYPINQIYENIKLDGKRYGIVKSSGELAYIGTDNSYNVLLSTLSPNGRLWVLQYNDECYLGTSEKENRWKFDPTAASHTLLISTYIPCSKYPLIYYDKAFAINITTPMANDTQITTSGDESVIRYSAIGDLKRWDGDFWIGVNRNDGDVITGAAVYRGNLYVFKTNSTHQLLRVDNEDNTDGERAVCVLSNIGCIANDTIKEVNGLLYWVSGQGVIEFDGTSYKIVSEDIKDDIQDVINQSNTGVSVLTNFTDTTSEDFASGTRTNIDDKTITGSIIISTNIATNIIHKENHGTATGGDASDVLSTERYQTFTSSYTLYLSSVQVWITQSTGKIINKPIDVRILSGYDGSNYYMSIPSTTVTYATPGGWNVINFTTHNVLMREGNTYSLYVGNGGQDKVEWDYNVNDTFPNGARGGISGNGDYLFRICAYGYKDNALIISKTKKVDATFSQWDTITANFNSLTAGKTGTNIKWYVSASTCTEFIGTSQLFPIATGYIISLSSQPYITWIASMTTSDVYVSPRIDDVSINYYHITPSYNMVGYSDQKNLRYWVSGTKSPASVNNVIYIYQIKTGKWTKHNLGVRAITDFRNDMVMGGSASTGKIYKYSDGYVDDAGTTIAPYVKSKDFILGSRMQDVKIGEIWYYAEPSVTYTTMTVTYFPNLKDIQWTTSSDIGLTGISGYTDMFIKKKVYVPTLDRIRTLGVKFTNFDRLYGCDIFYTVYPPGER